MPSSLLVQTGDRVCEQLWPITGRGTLGMFMLSGDECFGITAGHVLEKNGPRWTLTTDHLRGGPAQAQHVPVKSENPKDLFKGEVGILRLDPDTRCHVNTTIPRINVNLFGETQRLRFDPLHLNFGRFSARAFELQARMTSGPLFVFKQGITTGYTMGRLSQVMFSFPPSWLQHSVHGRNAEMTSGITDATDPLSWVNYSFDNLDAEMMKAPSQYRWLGLVEWSAGQVFTLPGDSGALVFAIQQTQVIPLGIHLGIASEYPGHSLFMGLESFVIEGKGLGLDLRFSE